MNEKPITSFPELGVDDACLAQGHNLSEGFAPEQGAVAPILQCTRERILEHVEGYARMQPKQDFIPGKTYVPASGKVVGIPEMMNMVDAALSLDLTITGKWNPLFEKDLAKFLGVDSVMTCNSGSSANLIAMSTLCSPTLGDNALKPGDEVICAAAGFPTTVNPIMQNGLVPVFVDAKIPYYNIDADKIEEAIGPKTVAIILDHTLGNPCDMDEIMRIAIEHDLWVIEDGCDSLGSTYRGQVTGTFGHLSTLSFYPAHHITTGEGGAVIANDPILRKIAASICNWGKHCHCPPNHDNVCGRRYEQQHGSLPYGFDHKYIFGEMGYNLKMTDGDAACGVAQMGRLPGFVQLRKLNFKYLTQGLKDLEEHLILPEAMPGSSPSWFGFPVTMRNGDRLTLLRFLEGKRIGTRLLFGGNLTRQPYMQGRNYRVSGYLGVTDQIMRDTFALGVWPGITTDMMDYMIEALHEYFK